MMAGNKKLHIVHISPNLGAGGAEFLVVGLCEHFVNLGFETTVITLFPPGGIDVSIALAQKRRLLDAGVRVIHLDKHLGSDPSMIPKLHRLLRDLKPHVVHTHRYVLRYTLLPMLLCRIPVRVHTVHNIAQKEVDRIGKLVHRFAFRFGGVVPVSISQEVANSVKAIYGRDIKSPVIYNGIPVQSFAEALKHQRENSENLVLLHIGRFAPQKNYRLLIEVFSLAVKEYPKMYLWLVGDGPLRSQIEELVFRRGLQDKVMFWGVRQDIPKLLLKSDIFILSSDYEGVPLSVLEAMAAGKPVVATAVGGVPELVEDGVTGVLVPPRNPEALAQGILRLAKDPHLRQRMGKAARERALERFDIARTAREYEALYLKLLRECGRA